MRDESTGLPQPPANLPKYLREGLRKQSPDRLRRAAEYAEALADHKEAEAKQQLEERANQSTDEVPDEWEDQENEWEDALEEVRDTADLPAGKGTLTKKLIDGREYWYLQWWTGDGTESQYVAPVTSASSSQ
jgi:hypothetical protein